MVWPLAVVLPLLEMLEVPVATTADCFAIVSNPAVDPERQLANPNRLGPR